jgi:hypothetical protein
MSLSSQAPCHPHTIGELCVGADWACAHGDSSALHYVAQQLTACASEPLHCALMELSDTCICDPDRAVLLWYGLKDQVYRADQLPSMLASSAGQPAASGCS